MTAIIIKGRSVSNNNLPTNNNLPSGLVACFNTQLTPGNSSFRVNPPVPFTNSTIATFAISFITNTSTSEQDICCANTGEFPRIVIAPNGRIQSYFIGFNPFFDIGIESIPINSNSKNVYILLINNTILQHQLNGNSTIFSNFQTGTPRTINLNQQYRLGGFVDNTRFFNGSYYFFGLWNRALTSSEIAYLNTIL